MSTLLLTRSNSLRATTRRHAIPMQFRVGQFFLMFSLMVMGAMMSLLYLMEYNGIHTKGYALKKLEIEREELQVASELKYTNLSKVTSLSHIENSDTVRRMIPVKNPVYSQGEGTYASR